MYTFNQQGYSKLVKGDQIFFLVSTTILRSRFVFNIDNNRNIYRAPNQNIKMISTGLRGWEII